MPLPASLLTATLTGTYVDDDGNPPSGQIRINRPARLVYDPAAAPADRCILVGTPLVFNLVAGGFSRTLLRTDNEGIGFEYTMVETITGRSTTELVFELTGDLDVSEVPV